jgi:hypothetical protein
MTLVRRPRAMAPADRIGVFLVTSRTGKAKTLVE